MNLDNHAGDPLDTEELSTFRSFVARRRWQRGKADPTHEYTIRNWVPDGENDFVTAIRIIRANGSPAPFFSKIYTYLTVDDMKYWTMGARV